MSDEQANRIIEPTAFTRAEATPEKPLVAINPLTVTIGIVFLMLSLAALFMFNARAVKLNFDPGVNELSINGSLPTYQLGERYLMLTGTYEISAQLEGHETLISTVAVGEAPEQAFDLTMKRLPGIVEITATHTDQQISDAEVFIDQELAGKTPITLDSVAAGIRDLYIRHPRFQPYETEIDVIGLHRFQTEAVDLTPAWASISVSTLPEGAVIGVDGVEVGITPNDIEVIEGTRTLRLKKPGYKSWESDLAVQAQVDQKLDEVVLVKSDGKLTITSTPAGANITIAGRYRGQTPLAIALPPNDNYELIATRAGHENLTRLLAIEAEEDQNIRLTMKPITGQVRVSILPAGGTLFVDNERVGEPNRVLELTARNHQIRIEQPGYAAYETSIIPQPDFAQQINVIMQTEAEARTAAIPERMTTALGDVMWFIVPGSLKMGAGRREPGRRSNEVEKTVDLTRAFYIGEKEISNKSFNQFDPAHDAGVLGRALLSEAERPVVNVSWDQAVRFCNWLSEQDGLEPAYEFRDGSWSLVKPVNTGYRPPFEAEWAWAARYASGSPTRFPWGDNMPPPAGAGNFADESAANMVPYSIIGYNDKFRGPAPPGTYNPNALGIYDLTGNVSEWIHDYYAVELLRETLADPTGPESGDYHVIRGSNYTHGRFSELRWTFRDYGFDGRPDVGFRIARYLE